MNVRIKAIKIVSLVIIFVIFILVILSFLATRNVNFEKDTSSSMQDTIMKIVKSCIDEKEVEITQGELNSAIESIIVNYDINDHTRIKGVYVNLAEDNTANIYIPLNYRGKDLVLSSNAKVSLVNDEIMIAINKLKLGKLPIPTNIIMKVISSAFLDNVSIDKNVIYCENQIPVNVFNNTMELKINKLYISDGNLILKLDGAKEIAGEYIKKYVSNIKSKFIR